MEMLNMKNDKRIMDAELDRIAGGSTIVSSGSAGYVSGDTPRWAPGDVLRVKYCEADGSTSCRAKCTVMSVSSSKIGGEFAIEKVLEGELGRGLQHTVFLLGKLLVRQQNMQDTSIKDSRQDMRSHRPWISVCIFAKDLTS